jgi:UDP-2,3-diacylglucosamine hydrolase
LLFVNISTSKIEKLRMQLPPGKKVYFASDFHLGIPNAAASLQREKLLCTWLDSIKHDAARLYLVGDIFDVWFEYKNVVPKGYTRFLGKLAELSDAGVIIEAFTGNHDLWMRGYFQEELNIKVHHQPLEVVIQEKQFFIAHGDGLGPGDHGYKFLKAIISNRFAQWLYRRLHPDTGVGIASYFSKKGPKHFNEVNTFLGEDKEWLMLFSKEKLQQKHYDYFVFGHRHIALLHKLSNNSIYVNLGDWISFNSYAVFDGTEIELKYFSSSH